MNTGCQHTMHEHNGKGINMYAQHNIIFQSTTQMSNVSMMNKEIYIDWNKTPQIFLSFCLIANSPEINTSHYLSRTVVLLYYAPLLCPWR